MNARFVDDLELETLEPQVVHHLWVRVAEDAMGQPVNMPVMVLRGRRSGPVFGLTAALHGNEVNGIPVIHRLLSSVAPLSLRGTIVAVLVVNQPGFHEHRRALVDGRDLNHQMPGRADGNRAEILAHIVLERVVRHLDLLVDLHTARRGCRNSLYIRADLDNAEANRMARRLRPQIILHSPPGDGTLRGAFLGPAITVEIGDPHRFQAGLIQRTVSGLRGLLMELGMIPKRKRAPLGATRLCRSSRWLYTDRGGLLTVLVDVNQSVAAGSVLAVQQDVFGVEVRRYLAPADGVVIGLRADPVCPTGSRVVHLGLDPKEVL